MKFIAAFTIVACSLFVAATTNAQVEVTLDNVGTLGNPISDMAGTGLTGAFRIGRWDLTPTQIQSAFAAGNIAALSSGFTQFGGQGTFINPGFFISQVFDDNSTALGVNDQHIDGWFSNSGAFDASSEHLIVTGRQSISDPGGTQQNIFPATDAFTPILSAGFGSDKVLLVVGGFANFQLSGRDAFNTVAIPEPSTTYALLGFGGAFLFGFLRRRER